MAKVGKEIIQHRSSTSVIQVNINFSTKSKTFYAVDLPEDVVTYYNESNNLNSSTGPVDSSYEGLVDKIKQLYQDFLEADIKQEKVILYKYQKNNSDSSEIAFAPKTALGLEFKVLYKINIGGKLFLCTSPFLDAKQPDVGFRVGGPRLLQYESHDFRNFKEVTHSEELEQFFNNTVQSMERMIYGVDKFFGNDAEHLLENFELPILAPKKDVL